MEKLSVIIPVYNVYPYLRECLESIINQTYKNLEIIIVNDASPHIEDDEICKEYALKDNRIIYIKHDENKFQGGARNTGIKASTGKYITFVDSDDYLIDLSAYEECIEKLKENPDVDIVSFDMVKEEGCKRQYCQMSPDEYVEKKYIDTKYFPTMYVWSKIFKKTLFDNTIWFQEKIKYEDIIFWYELNIKKKIKYLYIKKAYYNYRIHNSSTTQNKENYFHYYDILEILYKKIEDNNKRTQYIEPFFRNFLYIHEAKYNKLNDNEKKLFIERHIKLIEKTKITPDEIRRFGGYNYFNQFLWLCGGDTLRDLYISSLSSSYTKDKYKTITPNILWFKIKREVKRILKQLHIIRK